VVTDVCWGLFFIFDKDETSSREAAINSKVCSQLARLLANAVPLLSSSSQLPTYVDPSLKVLGAFTALQGTEPTQAVINSGVLVTLRVLLRSISDSSIKQSICWLISNITAGDSFQIEAVISADLIRPILDQLKESFDASDITAAKEIIYVIVNVFSNGSLEQIEYMLRLGSVRSLCLAFNFVETLDLAPVLS